MSKISLHNFQGTDFKIKENSWIARLAAFNLKSGDMAITIGKTVHLYHSDKEHFLKNRNWVKHELTHVAQFKKYGFFRFLCLYLWESLRHGYQNNRFEVEARKAAKQ